MNICHERPRVHHSRFLVGKITRPIAWCVWFILSTCAQTSPHIHPTFSLLTHRHVLSTRAHEEGAHTQHRAQSAVCTCVPEGGQKRRDDTMHKGRNARPEEKGKGETYHGSEHGAAAGTQRFQLLKEGLSHFLSPARATCEKFVENLF